MELSELSVFFVCGAPKSGTTWAQRILDAHPQVSCSGEGHFLERFVLPVAQTVGDYNRELGLETEQVYQGKPYYGPIGLAEFDALMRDFVLRRLASRGLAPEVRWAGDKTPGYTRHLDELARIFPEAKFIDIVRDPRDVTVSHLAHSRRAGVANAFDPEAPDHRELVQKAVNGWLQAVRAVDAFAERAPARMHLVRYRDLQEAPAATVEAMFDFLGAPTTPTLLDEIVAATSFEALSGRKPGAEDPDAFLRKGVSDDWKTELTPAAAEAIAQACGDLMRGRGLPL